MLEGCQCPYLLDVVSVMLQPVSHPPDYFCWTLDLSHFLPTPSPVTVSPLLPSLPFGLGNAGCVYPTPGCPQTSSQQEVDFLESVTSPPGSQLQCSGV